MIYFVLIFIQVLFGINFATSKYVLAHISSWDFVFIRFMLSALTLFAILSLAKKTLGINRLKLERKYLLWALALGTLGFSLSQTLFLQGLSMTTASNTSILSTTIPLLTYFVAILRRTRSIDLQSLSGFLLATIGILILKEVDQQGLNSQNYLGDFVVLLACLSIATFISFSKDFFAHVPSLLGTAYLFLFGSLALAPLSFGTDWSWAAKLGEDWIFTGCLFFTIFGATLLTYILSHWVIKKISSEYLSLYIFLQPIVAALLGQFFLGEEFSWRMPLSVVLMFIGVLFVTLKEAHIKSNPRD